MIASIRYFSIIHPVPALCQLNQALIMKSYSIESFWSVTSWVRSLAELCTDTDIIHN